MDGQDYSKKSHEELQAERDRIAADLRSVPKNDPRHKELEAKYNQIESEQRSRAPELKKEQRETFRPEQDPELRYFPPGSRFQKHADSDAVEQNRPMSPYWSSSEPVTMKDGTKATGMNEVSDRYQGDPKAVQEHQRFRSAVSYDWDTKANQHVEMELKEGKYGYVGRANNQPYHKSGENVTMMGGDHQVVMPDLKQQDYSLEKKGPPVAGSVEEQRKQNEATAAERLNGGQGPRQPPPGGGAPQARRAPPGYSSPEPQHDSPEKGRSR
jgi:hypothetical protein